MSDISVLGLGSMGAALARALQRAGHRITVWNRSPEKMQPFVANGADGAPAVAPTRARGHYDGATAMGKLTEDMKRVVSEQKLGFVATVSEDGTPNLSPKGTFIVLDDNHIMFGEIRSPNTVKNLVNRPTMEVNFVDPFARKGFRAKGRATFVPRGTPEFDQLLPRFTQWGELTDKFNGIVKLRVERAAPVISPAYDTGAEEADLRDAWMAHFAGLHSHQIP